MHEMQLEMVKVYLLNPCPFGCISGHGTTLLFLYRCTLCVHVHVHVYVYHSNWVPYLVILLYCYLYTLQEGVDGESDASASPDLVAPVLTSKKKLRLGQKVWIRVKNSARNVWIAVLSVTFIFTVVAMMVCTLCSLHCGRLCWEILRGLISAVFMVNHQI